MISLLTKVDRLRKEVYIIMAYLVMLIVILFLVLCVIIVLSKSRKD